MPNTQPELSKQLVTASLQDAVSFIQKKSAQTKKSWVVVGKGPSSERYVPADFLNRNVITLNHACRLIPPDIAHFVDWDAYESCRDFLTPGSFVAMPWHPHIKNKATTETLHRLLTTTDARFNWLVYDASSAQRLKKATNRRHTVLRYFSATAVFDLLVQAGEKRIESVGVDGGKRYAKQFSVSTLLSNGQATFDVQMPVLLQICRNIDWVRLPTTPSREEPT